MGLVASGISLRMTSPLMVKPCATAASRASVTGRPELLVPSPDTSITRRSDWYGLRLSWAMPKSMAALIEVRPMKARGASLMRLATASASSALPIWVQSITSIWSVSPAHSTKHSAMRPIGPPTMARTTRGSTMAAA